jgi:hypothetical protein
MSESGIFKVAVKLPPDRRADYLNEACGSDTELRGEVESLLRAHDASCSFLCNDASQQRTADYEPIAERPGSEIGSYRLMEQIGEGPNQAGFGQSSGSINPGPQTPNPLAGQQAAQAQPRMPPDQTQTPAPEQQGQSQAQSALQNTAPNTPVFSVLHPPSDQARWQQIGMAPFENIGQNNRAAINDKSAQRKHA